MSEQVASDVLDRIVNECINWKEYDIDYDKAIDILAAELAIAKAPLRWSTEKPTVPGWYWYRSLEQSVVVNVDKINKCQLVVNGEGMWKFDGEFAGPLEAPQ
jgi:hypothetical protein